MPDKSSLEHDEDQKLSLQANSIPDTSRSFVSKPDRRITVHRTEYLLRVVSEAQTTS